jgi:site-specific DNA-methyltransferase (adenine-specific)
MFKEKNYELWQGDCLELMKDIPNKSIDCIICDLPYGTTACKWDTIIPFEPLWEQYNRVIKENGAIVLFGSEPFSTELRHSNLKMYKYDWIWDKVQPTGMTLCNKQPMKNHEIISVFGKGKINYYPQMEDREKELDTTKWEMKKLHSENGNYSSKDNDSTKKVYKQKYPRTIITFHKSANECNNTKRVHPTQKPVALLEYLIKTYTQEGEVILDNTMGSGSTGVAAMNLHRKFIGMELEPQYFEIAKKRIQDIVV